jgi:hypothetical protein
MLHTCQQEWHASCSLPCHCCHQFVTLIQLLLLLLLLPGYAHRVQRWQQGCRGARVLALGEGGAAARGRQRQQERVCARGA